MIYYLTFHLSFYLELTLNVYFKLQCLETDRHYSTKICNLRLDLRGVGSNSSGNDFNFLGYNCALSVKSQQCFQGTCRLHLQCHRISQAINLCDVGSRQCNQVTEISNYRRRDEMQVSQCWLTYMTEWANNQQPMNNLSDPTDCSTQMSEPIGDKTRLISVALKRPVFELVYVGQRHFI